MAIPVALVTQLLIPVIKKIISKPKTGVKEASFIVLATMGNTLFTQYQAGGVESLDGQVVAAFIAALYALGARLYAKHKEAKQAEKEL